MEFYENLVDVGLVRLLILCFSSALLWISTCCCCQ